MAQINMFEDENKKICSKIKNEDNEGERLRHLLNYINTGI